MLQVVTVLYGLDNSWQLLLVFRWMNLGEIMSSINLKSSREHSSSKQIHIYFPNKEEIKISWSWKADSHKIIVSASDIGTDQ